MNQTTIKRKRNPQYLADAIWINFGSSRDSRVGYDGANNEWTLQSKDAGGTQTDRVRVKANQDITQFELYNDDPGATGVQLDVHHDSASPAAADVILHVRAYGEDSGSAKTQYAGIKVTLDDATDTSEDATVGVEMVTAGTLRTASFPNITADDTVAVLALAQTLSNKTLTSPVLTTPQINDTSADHQYVFAVSELAADRTVTLPLLDGNATFSFIDFAETISAVKTHSADIVLNDNVNLGLGTSSGEGTISSDGTSIKIGSVAGKDIILGDNNEVMRVSGGDVVIFGSGEGGTTLATGKTIRAPDITTGGAGNIAGADLTIIPGLGTGTGDVGQIIIRAARVAAAGDNIQTLNTAFVVDDDGTNPILDLQGTTTLLNVGASGNDWTANAFTHKASAGGSQSLTVENTNTGGGSDALIRATVTSTSSDPRFVLQVSGSNAWHIGLRNVSSDRFYIGTAEGSTNNALRITQATPPVITYNTTHPTGTFDYVCSICGHHSDEPFMCHGQRAEWQDDVMVFRSMVLRQETGIDQMVKVGVMERTFNNDGEPEVFTRLGADWLFVGAMAYQNRIRMDSLHLEHQTRFSTVEDRVGTLEEAQEILRAQVVALGATPEEG